MDNVLVAEGFVDGSYTEESTICPAADVNGCEGDGIADDSAGKSPAAENPHHVGGHLKASANLADLRIEVRGGDSGGKKLERSVLRGHLQGRGLHGQRDRSRLLRPYRRYQLYEKISYVYDGGELRSSYPTITTLKLVEVMTECSTVVGRVGKT